MQGDTCAGNAIELKHIVAVASNVTDENDLKPEHDLTIEIIHFTDNQLELIEADLKKSQTLETVQRSMNILRIVRNGLLNYERYGPNWVIRYAEIFKFTYMVL